MSRSGYSDDCEHLNLWRGSIARATQGKRGQEFFRSLVAALDALPDKRLIAGALEAQGTVCALGAVGRLRGVDMDATSRAMNNGDRDALGETFCIAPGLAAEVMYVNDECGSYNETPEQRWERVRKWAAEQVLP